MSQEDVEDMVTPAGVALVGALTVVIFYWIHKALFGADVVSATGVEITLFISAFWPGTSHSDLCTTPSGLKEYRRIRVYGR